MQINNISSNQLAFSGKKKAANNEISMRMDLNTFVNASDEQLYAYAQAQNKQKHKGSTPKFIGACVGVDVLSSAILKSQVLKKVEGEVKVVKAPLSAKIGAGARTLKGWGLGFVAAGALMGIKGAILDKSEKFKTFEENHPIGSLFAEIGALALIYRGGKLTLNKMALSTKLAEKTAPLGKVVKKAAHKIDNSKISTFIMNRCSEVSNAVSQKAPAFGKTCRMLLSNSVLLMLIGGMMNISKNNREIQQSYEQMKMAQDQILQNISD